MLPFDANTSVSEQASSSRPDLLAALHGLPMESFDSPLEARLDPRRKRALVAAAHGLRKLIRVKIADDADLAQVHPAAAMLPCCHAAMLLCCHVPMLPCCHAAAAAAAADTSAMLLLFLLLLFCS